MCNGDCTRRPPVVSIEGHATLDPQMPGEMLDGCKAFGQSNHTRRMMHGLVEAFLKMHEQCQNTQAKGSDHRVASFVQVAFRMQMSLLLQP